MSNVKCLKWFSIKSNSVTNVIQTHQPALAPTRGGANIDDMEKNPVISDITWNQSDD